MSEVGPERARREPGRFTKADLAVKRRNEAEIINDPAQTYEWNGRNI